MKKITSTFTYGALLLATSSLGTSAWAGNPAIYEPSLLPSNAQAGQCYARVHIPAQYSTSPETVLVAEGYSVVEVDQARLASRTQQVEIKEASVRFEVRQPSYRTVSEQMMVRPSYDKLSVVAPRFETVREVMTTSAPRRVWKRGNPGTLAAQGYTIISTADAGQNGRGYSSTQSYGAARNNATRCGAGCEIWCLVEEPGERISFDRKVMTSPGTTRRTRVPAKYTSITKQVVADPGGVREIPVPAEFRGVQVEHIVDPGGERLVNVPAKYGNVDKKTLISVDRYEWRRVVCDPAKGRSSTYQGRSSSYGGATTSSYTSPSTYSNSGYSNQYRSGAVSSGSSYGSTYTGSNYAGYGNTVATPAPVTTGTYYYGTNRPVD